MKRKIPKIRLTKSTDVSQYRQKPLSRQQTLSRLDWIGACVPVHQANKSWVEWAFKRMDELNDRLRTFTANNPSGAQCRE